MAHTKRYLPQYAPRITAVRQMSSNPISHRDLLEAIPAAKAAPISENTGGGAGLCGLRNLLSGCGTCFEIGHEREKDRTL